MMNQIEQVPDELFGLPLVYLNLCDNQLTDLPDAVGRLGELAFLGLDSNRLVRLPDSIGDLRQLTGLTVSWNQLTTVPSSIANLTQLQFLHLSGNPFTSLPAELGPLVDGVDDFEIDGTHRRLFMDWTYQPTDVAPQREITDAALTLSATDPSYNTVVQTLTAVSLDEHVGKVRRSIAIHTTVPDDYAKKGSSRFGGCPDLAAPSDFPTTDGLYWAFLAQISLADIAGLNEFLPTQGLLSFFIASTMDDEAKVLHTESPPDLLQTVRIDPSDMLDEEDDYIATPHRLRFEPATDFPPHLMINSGAPQYERLYEALGPGSNHAINGYTYSEGESPQHRAANELRGAPEEWVSLLQLGFDKNVGFCFLDAGTITFSIHREALSRNDFSQVHYSIDSS